MRGIVLSIGRSVPAGGSGAMVGRGYDHYTHDVFLPAIPLSSSRQRRLDQVIQEPLSGHGRDESHIDQPLNRPRTRPGITECVPGGISSG